MEFVQRIQLFGLCVYIGKLGFISHLICASLFAELDKVNSILSLSGGIFIAFDSYLYPNHEGAKRLKR